MHRAARRLHDIETLCDAAVTQLVSSVLMMIVCPRETPPHTRTARAQPPVPRVNPRYLDSG